METPTYDPRLAGTRKALGEALMNKVINSRVLVVGAGGIGCELLKNLVLTGFTNIETIDLDTIDTSNLNRQFLFHKADVGKSKSLTASVSCKKYNPNVNIKAYFGNVKDAQFGPSYVKGFDLVMNALDNVAARRHVNRICLATGVPLVESGTAGYLGQVQVIRTKDSECYECVPQAPPKSFPICTIRLNPSTTIHCIVWAQSVYKRNFGEVEEGEANQEVDDLPKEEQKGELTEEEKNEQILQEKDKVKLKSEQEKSFIRGLFHELFHSDVLYLSTLKSLWIDKTPPVPIFLSETSDELDERFHDMSPFFQSYVNNAVLPDQRVWGPRENAMKFLESAKALRELGTREKWEKDNQIHLDFVTSAANLRACIFHLDLSSRFFVKEQAGNIIPAIATTNAIAAGLIVMKALRILDGHLLECHNTYLRKQPNRGILFLSANLDPPNPQCYVCSKHMLSISVNTQKMKVCSLVDVIQNTLKITSPVIGIGNIILIDAAEADDDDPYYATAVNKLLSEKQISHNVVLDLSDNDSLTKVDLTVFHDDSKNENEFEIIGNLPKIIQEAEKQEKEEEKMEVEVKKDSGGVIQIEDDDMMIISVAPQAQPQAQPQEEVSKKRKAEDDIDDGVESKKSKANDGNQIKNVRSDRS